MKLDILMLPSMYNNSVGEASFAYCMQLEILKASSLIFSIVELGSRSILRSNINKKTRSKTCLSFITIVLSSSGPSPFLAPMSTTKKVKDLFIIYQYCIVELRSGPCPMSITKQCERHLHLTERVRAASPVREKIWV